MVAVHVHPLVVLALVAMVLVVAVCWLVLTRRRPSQVAAAAPSVPPPPSGDVPPSGDPPSGGPPSGDTLDASSEMDVGDSMTMSDPILEAASTTTTESQMLVPPVRASSPPAEDMPASVPKAVPRARQPRRAGPSKATPELTEVTPEPRAALEAQAGPHVPPNPLPYAPGLEKNKWHEFNGVYVRANNLATMQSQSVVEDSCEQLGGELPVSCVRAGSAHQVDYSIHNAVGDRRTSPPRQGGSRWHRFLSVLIVLTHHCLLGGTLLERCTSAVAAICCCSDSSLMSWRDALGATRSWSDAPLGAVFLP